MCDPAKKKKIEEERTLTMKKMILVLAVLLIASPTLADVTITATYPGSGDIVSIGFVNADAAKVRAFALDISVTDGNIVAISNANAEYTIYPGSIEIDDDGNPVSDGLPICSAVYPGTEAGLGTDAITIEMGSLYDGDAPAQSGKLIDIQVDSNCDVALALNAIRGGVVMEDPALSPTVVLVGVGDVLPPPPTYPACWDETQCNGDTNGDGTLNTTDFFAFKDSYGKSYGDDDYDECADFNRDGTLNTTDFFTFKDNYGQNVASDCSVGGTWPPTP